MNYKINVHVRLSIFFEKKFEQNSWKHLENIKIIHRIYFWKIYMYVRLFGRILGWLFLVDGQISADWPPQISSNFLQLKKARGEGLSYKIGSNKNNFRGTVKSRSKLPFGKNWFMRLIKEPSLLLICKRSHWNYFFSCCEFLKVIAQSFKSFNAWISLTPIRHSWSRTSAFSTHCNEWDCRALIT